mmetsp:Transcript_93353/g.302091  ORF Transcript_93353/g.302091 Transcript_93353/m.302091 type:complete len:285 (+) Transcript_93353:6711-7565(+)
MPPNRDLFSPNASSYSSMSSSGRLASFKPSSTSAFCKSSDRSSHAKVGFGPAAQLTFPVEPRKTGKTAEVSDALKVEAASKVCNRSPRSGKTEKNSSSCMPLKMTCEQQWVISSCMAPDMTPVRSILFQLLSRDGSRSTSSGRGSDLREDKRANPPWIQAELLVLKGVGSPTQILPLRCSSSKGLIFTAQAPCGYRATPKGRSSCSFKTSNIFSSVMPMRCAMAHSAVVSSPGLVMVIIFVARWLRILPSVRSSGDLGIESNQALYSSSFWVVACTAAISSSPL